MKRTVLAVLVLLLAGLAGCVFESDDSYDPGFDFNGIWRFALTGCQSQFADSEIVQSGPNLTMFSTYRFDGLCDPYSGEFDIRTDQPWGFWAFSGRVTGPETLAGTYFYADRRGECAGTFSAVRIEYRAADVPAGAGLSRKP
jgi:hypothetical protein